MRIKVWIFEPGEIPTLECNLYEIEWSTDEFSSMMALMGLDAPVRFIKIGGLATALNSNDEVIAYIVKR